MKSRSNEAVAGDRGYFSVVDSERRLLLQGEVEIDRREIHVMGDDPIVIDKMFGPLAFWPVRITASIETCEWVIERMFGPEGEWREVARVPGQLEEDYLPDDV
jgi:hypothetical protein